MTIVYILLTLGFIGSSFVLWCIIRVGDDTHRPSPHPGKEALVVYLMQRERERKIDVEWNRLQAEERWRTR